MRMTVSEKEQVKKPKIRLKKWGKCRISDKKGKKIGISIKKRKILMTAHNRQKSKKGHSLYVASTEIYSVEAFGLKKSNNTLKIMIFCEYVKFGAVSWTTGILSIKIKFESKNSFAHMLFISFWLSAEQSSLLPNQFYLNTDFPSILHLKF